MNKPVRKKRRQLSIGEIHRRKLLKSRTGEPYASKGAVSKALRGYPFDMVETPNGPAKMYYLDVIIRANLDRQK